MKSKKNVVKEQDRLLRIEEVSLYVGSSIYAINYWYAWKRKHPENEIAKKLPEFIQDHPRGTRMWKESELWRIIEFKQALPKGRNGILGDITQRYWHKKKNEEKENAEKANRNTNKGTSKKEVNKKGSKGRTNKG